MNKAKYRVWCKDKNEYEKDQCFLTQVGKLVKLEVNGNMQVLSSDTHTL